MWQSSRSKTRTNFFQWSAAGYWKKKVIPRSSSTTTTSITITRTRITTLPVGLLPEVNRRLLRFMPYGVLSSSSLHLSTPRFVRHKRRVKKEEKRGGGHYPPLFHSPPLLLPFCLLVGKEEAFSGTMRTYLLCATFLHCARAYSKPNSSFLLEKKVKAFFIFFEGSLKGAGLLRICV